MNTKATDVGLYIHVAFCKTICPYCDFNTYAGIAGLIPRYLSSLATQCASLSRAIPSGIDNIRNERLEIATIFFGGGTPSLIPAGDLERVLQAIGRSAKIEPQVEVTLEANPNDISDIYLRGLREIGVNRLSIGVQSFDDRMLKILGRRHDASSAEGAFESARIAGFDNVSLDLMFGLPGQSVERWRQSLSRAIRLQPEHLSLYNLTIEESTPFHQWAAQGKIIPPTQDAQADMYEVAMDVLDACGYFQYEISNWARRDRKDYRSRHNLRYWRNQPYIGLGAGAHSYYSGSRFSSVSDPHQYVELVESDRSTIDWIEAIDLNLEMAETAMLGLRLNEGLSQLEFHRRFGRPIVDVFPQVVERCVDLRLLTVNDDSVRLTRRGRMLGNEVFASFLSQGAAKPA